MVESQNEMRAKLVAERHVIRQDILTLLRRAEEKISCRDLPQETVRQGN